MPKATYLTALLLFGCSHYVDPDESTWTPPTQSAAGAGGTVSLAGGAGAGGSPQSDDGGSLSDAGGPVEDGGVAASGGASQAGSSAGVAGSAASVGGMPGGSGAPAAGAGGSGGAVAGQSSGGHGGALVAVGGGAGAGVAGKAGAAGSGPVDQCASMPGKLLASYPATNAKIDGGTSSAAPATTTHTLRVWFTSPAGYCDETFGGSPAPALTLKNDQTGDFALPGADLCFNGNTTGEVHIDPAGGFVRVNGMGAGWTVQGICVRVRRNHWDVQFHVNGDVDETWELWGTP